MVEIAVAPASNDVALSAPVNLDITHPETLNSQKESFTKEAIRHHQVHREKHWQNIPEVKVTVEGEEIVPSYHNEKHILAITKASSALIESAKKGNDPMEIEADLGKYNESNGTSFTLSDLSVASELAFAGHDLGNITKSDDFQVDQAGSIVLDYADKYIGTSGPPEERGAVITDKLVNHFFPNDPKVQALKPLIKHLIKQTVFNGQPANRNVPFNLFVQMTDQVAQYYFSQQSVLENAAGFIMEKGYAIHTDKDLPDTVREKGFPITPRQSILFPEQSVLRLLGVKPKEAPTQDQEQMGNAIVNVMRTYGDSRATFEEQYVDIHARLDPSKDDPNNPLNQIIDWNDFGGVNGARAAAQRVLAVAA